MSRKLFNKVFLGFLTGRKCGVYDSCTWCSADIDGKCVLFWMSTLLRFLGIAERRK